jgi:hypothetical protein
MDDTPNTRILTKGECCVQLEVLAAVINNNTVFWYMAPCSLVEATADFTLHKHGH